ncbi:FAD binding domain-containing protein [Thermostichus sp. MS-CIW-30]
MDLHHLHTYIRPQQLEDLTAWDPGWNWLAGGTWLFSQPQPHLRGLIDLHPLDWNELEISAEGLKLGATCTFQQLLQYDWPPHWPGIRALCEGMASLASFKVAHLATIGGNLCLALSVGVVAPVLIALEATYTLIDLQGSLRHIPAQDFQTGPQQTLLQPGEALRLDPGPTPAQPQHLSAARHHPNGSRLGDRCRIARSRLRRLSLRTQCCPFTPTTDPDGIPARSRTSSPTFGRASPRLDRGFSGQRPLPPTHE